MCKIHQNFKLLLNGLRSVFDDLSVNTYEDVLSNMICDEPSNNCYLKKCNLCPSFSEIALEIEDFLTKNNILSITYQQWTNTDRSSLDTIAQETEGFIQTMSMEADILLVHNFIAKEQSKLLKNLKCNLQDIFNTKCTSKSSLEQQSNDSSSFCNLSS